MTTNVAVVGLGYVGIPVAVKLASSGTNVIGIDIDETKVSKLNSSEYPLRGKEPDIQGMLESVISNDSFRATSDFTSASDADFWMICVQTPLFHGSVEPNLGTLKKALGEIGKNLKKNSTVVIESTIPPGTTEKVAIPLLQEISGMTAGKDFGVGHCPERVMPGKLLHNLSNYDRVLGAINSETGSIMHDIYSRITKGELRITNIRTAEVVKTFENTYRDAEIAIANDFAKYCDSVGVDFFEVREHVNRVESRNLHLPGGGVGGHCIPKDTWLLAHGSKGVYDPSFLTMARQVNDSMPEYVFNLCYGALRKASIKLDESKITILGLSYLEESDDVRNSPSAVLYEKLISEGADVRVHDHYADDHPNVEHTTNLESSLAGSDILIVMVAHEKYREMNLSTVKSVMRNPIVIDARNVFSKQILMEEGFQFSIIGRGSSF
jgi:UDP-N-acetyl-D-mannosaminuronic acid dehydrogenase